MDNVYKVGDLVRLRREPEVYKITYIDTINAYVNLVNVTYTVGTRSEKMSNIYPLSKQETATFLINKMFKTITT